MGVWIELRREEYQGRGQTMNAATHWETGSMVGTVRCVEGGAQGGVQGKTVALAGKAVWIKRQNVTCQTKECGETGDFSPGKMM